LRRYMGDALPDRMAQTMAYVYQGKLPQAEQRLAPLLTQYPTDPYLQELSGHLALDSGQVAVAEQRFAHALQLNPNMPIVRYHLASALQAQEKYAEAVQQLELIRGPLDYWPAVFYALGLNYGKLNKLAESQLDLTEYALLRGEVEEAREHLLLAKPHLPAQGRLQARWQQMNLEVEKLKEQRS
ncbi:MAG: tetratricopeptide repeat protein, partial [Alphaproteobacteria bacterium]